MTKELPYKKVIKESSQKCKKTNIYNDVRQLINKKFYVTFLDLRCLWYFQLFQVCNLLWISSH